MIRCSNCGNEQNEQNQVCSNCGLFLYPDSVDDPVAGSFLTPGDHLQNGRYIVQERLGQGGMGAVFLASDTHLLNKRVVVKALLTDPDNPESAQEIHNFIREVEMLVSLHHPLIPAVNDHFQDGSHYFMVQEYVEGENLEEHLQRLNQPMQEREVLQYASQVLEILDYLHQQTPPIVHRDIKPANIIIGARDKQPHLVDFGIARTAGTLPTLRQQTSALGTPGFAPREQYQRNADPRSDLYALAVTFHYLLTNSDPATHAPFHYAPVRALNPALSREVEQMLDHALANDPDERYQSAEEMKEAVDSILRDQVTPSEEHKQPILKTQLDNTVRSSFPPRTPAPVRPFVYQPTPQPGRFLPGIILVLLLVVGVGFAIPWLVRNSTIAASCNSVSPPVSGNTASVDSGPGSIANAYYQDLQRGGSDAFKQPGESYLYAAADYWASDETSGGQQFNVFNFVYGAAAANANPISDFAVCSVTFTPGTSDSEAMVVVAVVRSVGSSSNSRSNSPTSYAVTLTLKIINGSWKIVGADGI